MLEKLQYGFDALDHALDRASRMTPDGRFVPLAEALLWLVIINDVFWADNTDAYQSAREADADGQVIEGLRYARHRLTHDIDVTGMHEPSVQRGVLGRDPIFGQDAAMNDDYTMWRWRSVEELPEAVNRAGEAIYLEHLVNREVEASLRNARAFLVRYRTETETELGE